MAAADQDAVGGEPVEEVGLASRCRGGGADFAAELVPGDLGSALPAGLVLLGCGGASVTGAVDGSDAMQVVALLEVAGDSLSLVSVVPGPGGAAVLADEGGDDVDVVVGVADGDPPHGLVVAVWGESDTGHEFFGDVLPLLVGQGPVDGMVADRAVPHGQRRRARGRSDGLFQELDQLLEGVPARRV